MKGGSMALHFLRSRLWLAVLPYKLLGVYSTQLYAKVGMVAFHIEYAHLNPIQRFLKSKGA
jgi:hypothetical protein